MNNANSLIEQTTLEQMNELCSNVASDGCEAVDVQPICGTGFLVSGSCSPTAVDHSLCRPFCSAFYLAVGCLSSAVAASEAPRLALHAQHGTSFLGWLLRYPHHSTPPPFSVSEPQRHSILRLSSAFSLCQASAFSAS
eukprot:scaffold229006_cov21-Prasinocladus_malaysianus.AAC.1